MENQTGSMRRPMSRRAITAAAAVVLCLGLAACAPGGNSDANTAANNGGNATTPAADTATTSNATGDDAAQQAAEPGAYVSDEQCLSCHGGSYEALAETTASYGLSNPHDSIHGGYNACVNCHARDKEITDNQCLHCHDWPHNPESGLGA